MRRWSRYSLCLAIFTCPFGMAGAQEYYDAYDLAPSTKFVDLAVQPMAYPLAFISSTMQHDRLLREELKRLGMELRTFPFRKGNDVVKLVGDGKIEMAFLGDMPTVNTVMRTPTWIAGLGKRNFSSVVSRDYAQIEALKGKRVGYSAGSSSHLVLLRGLRAAKMVETDVTLVSLEPSQMPDALDNGNVDAYSAWEPTPSISMARSPKNRAIYRGMSTDWVIFSREFAEKSPAVATALLAAYARSINWMRASAANTTRVAHWVLADGEAFTGKPSALPVAKAVDIVRKDLLDVPGAPAVPLKVDGMAPLVREFEFLQQQGRIGPEKSPDSIAQAFAYPGLKQVQSDPKKHRLYQFDYDH